MTVPRFCLPVFCLLLLAACGRQPEPEPTPVPAAPATADPAPAEPDSEPAFAAVSAGTDAGYYLTGTPDPDTKRGLLCYIDYAGAQMLPLCAAPGCAHADESCTAYALGQMLFPGQVFAAGDTLYLLQTSAGKDSGCRLTAAGLDGSNAHTLLEFDPAYYQLLTPCTDGETLYVLASAVDEATRTAGTCLLRVDLASGACTEAAKFTDGAVYMLDGGQGQALVLERIADGAFTRQLFDPATGELGEPVPFEPEPPAAAPLSYQTADGNTVPIRPLAETGTDFLVRYGEEETATAAGPVYRPQYALIAKDDYYAGKPDWRPVGGV